MESTVNMLNATELYTLKWLNWWILCYGSFTTVKKKNDKKNPENTVLHSGMKKQMELASDGV